MSFRKYVLNKYISWSDIEYVISHHWRRYIKILMGYFFLLLTLFFIYYKLSYFIENKYFDYFFWLIAFILYIKFVIDFLDIYLDSLVIVDSWVIIFYWEGLFKYNSEFIDWDIIEAIYDEQDGILDILLNKWKIKIKRYDQEYVFDDVTDPSKQSGKIIFYKNKFTSSNKNDNFDKEKKDIDYQSLVEAVADVIYSYKFEKKDENE